MKVDRHRIMIVIENIDDRSERPDVITLEGRARAFRDGARVIRNILNSKRVAPPKGERDGDPILHAKCPICSRIPPEWKA